MTSAYHEEPPDWDEWQVRGKPEFLGKAALIRPSTASAKSGPVEAVPSFRPALRPPMAILCAFDDGQETGEIVRIRVPSFVIGRSEGAFLVPHDAGISGRHAEIGRRLADERYRW